MCVCGGSDYLLEGPEPPGILGDGPVHSVLIFSLHVTLSLTNNSEDTEIKTKFKVTYPDT